MEKASIPERLNNLERGGGPSKKESREPGRVTVRRRPDHAHDQTASLRERLKKTDHQEALVLAIKRKKRRRNYLSTKSENNISSSGVNAQSRPSGRNLLSIWVEDSTKRSGRGGALGAGVKGKNAKNGPFAQLGGGCALR